LLELATRERRVLLGEGQNWYPRFSPDGKWLIYTAAVDAKGEDLDLFAISVEGGEPIRLVSSPGRESEGRWKPAPCPCR
jgi:TolB protein